MPLPRRIMTVAEVAEYLHVSLATVHRLARHGLMPAFRIGRDYRFDRNAIEKMVTDRKKGGVEEKPRDGSRCAKENSDALKLRIPGNTPHDPSHTAYSPCT